MSETTHPVGARRPAKLLPRPMFVVGLWLLASVLPFTLFARVLLTSSLADTPYAYLLWVPVFAFLWALFGLRQATEYADDPELNTLLALPIALFCAVILVHGLGRQWSYFFLSHQLGLLFWPLWMLAMGWLLFGLGVTRYLWRPAVYLFLSWPPLYARLIDFTTPILDAVANSGVRLLARSASWLQVGTPPGTYLVAHAGHVTPVYVSSACSGADSLIAMVILIPVVLVTERGGWGPKLWTVCLGVVLALAGNWFRLGIIIAALHLTGPVFALDILHPLLGVILFAAIWWILLKIAHALGLRSAWPKRSFRVHSAGSLRASAAALLTVALTGTLWYLQPAQGSVLHPVRVDTSDLRTLAPDLPGWSKRFIGNYNESSILGTGAATAAFAYTTPQSDYALTELWWSYRPMTLEGYGVQDCLLFHGYQVLGSAVMRLTRNISATSYVAVLTPNAKTGKRQVFVDTVYDLGVVYHGRQALVRIESATPIAQVSSLAAAAPYKSLASTLPRLMQRPYPANLAGAGLNPNQLAHLYNYYIFIRQFGGQWLGHRAILDYPPF